MLSLLKTPWAMTAPLQSINVKAIKIQNMQVVTNIFKWYLHPAMSKQAKRKGKRKLAGQSPQNHLVELFMIL